MEYKTIKEISELWGVSPAMIRKYCSQGRIPGAKRETGGWMIPSKSEKPEASSTSPIKADELHPLARKIRSQKNGRNFHGLYDYIQINAAYSSSRMASNRLTRDQVETIFRKGKVSDCFEPLKVSDLIEVMNHCVCMDHVIDTIEMPLSVKYIKRLHEMLMYGTVDDRLLQAVPGELRNSKSRRKEKFISPADEINDRLIKLVKKYESLREVERREILDFHYQFECIFPFEDGNGRIGRLIMFKECLRHDVMPFILDDKKRTGYLDGLRNWKTDTSILSEVVIDSQERFNRQIERQILRAYGKEYEPK